MNNKPDFLQTIRSARAPVETNASAQRDEDEAAALAFGYLRGVRDRALHLIFQRDREGDRHTFPYSWLGPIRHHPSLGITMLFAGSEFFLVNLKGRNLTQPVAAGIDLFERGLVRHRVTWIREMKPEESKMLPKEECVIDRIEITAVTPEIVAKTFGI